MKGRVDLFRRVPLVVGDRQYYQNIGSVKLIHSGKESDVKVGNAPSSPNMMGG
jgi:hypothetical protein